MQTRFLAPALVLIACLGCAPEDQEIAPSSLSTAVQTDDPYTQEIDAWHAGRVERLRNPDGWLSLTALLWLDENGRFELGSSADADLVLPEGWPAKVGTIVVRPDGIRIEAETIEGLTIDGESALDAVELTADADGDPNLIEFSSHLAYAIRRGQRFGLRVKDREAQKIADFTGIDRYPVDPKWRIEATIERYAEPRVLSTPDVTGGVTDRPCYGALVFEVDGQEQRVQIGGALEGELSLVFADATSGETTYGGGRFLTTETVTELDTVVLDFNKAYNPPCIFTPFATCPLPPEGNRLEVAVTAGEKSWGH